MQSQGVVLITGAARRIGKALAERLAQEGFELALHSSVRSRDQAQALADQMRSKGVRAAVFTADLADAAATQALIPQITQQWQAPVVLINNASVFENDSADQLDPAFFDRMMAVNLRAPALLAASFAQALSPAHQGVIINLIDQRVWKLTPQFYSYTLSKAGLWAATQTMAQSFAPHIRVNAIGPGPVLPNGPQGEGAFAQEVAGIPLASSVDPAEIAAAAVYLIAARSVTGQMIAVDGGQHLGWRTPDIVD
jgi:NAD(P)-dependent dehydrogenase (short-subunit alcohol dehydrogenase family)